MRGSRPQALHFFSVSFEEGPSIFEACKALSASKILLEVIVATSRAATQSYDEAAPNEKHAIYIATYDSSTQTGMPFFKEPIDAEVLSIYKKIDPSPTALVVKRVHCNLSRDKAIVFYSTVFFILKITFLS